MPEGPTLIILKEEVQQFKGLKILEVNGNSKIDQQDLLNKKIVDFKTWGKHFLICLPKYTVKIHFLLFGKYTINGQRKAAPKLHLGFKKGELNFYASSITRIDEDLDEIYDWEADVMSDKWNEKAVLKKLKAHPDMLICDALLEQDFFAGVGNIIKNEVLFRQKVHPLSIVGKIPAAKLKKIIEDTRVFSFLFLDWKKKNVLTKHLEAHKKKICPRDKIPYQIKDLGKKRRKAYYCEQCMKQYGG
jgi:endonuclease-8